MRKIYKITKSPNFSPLVQEYQPYMKPDQQYCASCGQPNTFDLVERVRFSTYTGNKVHVLRLVCSKGGANHMDIKVMDVYEWKQDGKLYTGDFADPQEYIYGIKEK